MIGVRGTLSTNSLVTITKHNNFNNGLKNIQVGKFSGKCKIEFKENTKPVVQFSFAYINRLFLTELGEVTIPVYAKTMHTYII